MMLFLLYDAQPISFHSFILPLSAIWIGVDKEFPSEVHHTKMTHKMSHFSSCLGNLTLTYHTLHGQMPEPDLCITNWSTELSQCMLQLYMEDACPMEPHHQDKRQLLPHLPGTQVSVAPSAT